MSQGMCGPSLHGDLSGLVNIRPRFFRLQLSNCLTKMQGMIMAIEANSEKLLTTEEAADYLHLSAHTVRKYLTRRLIKPAKRIGASYLIEQSECDRFKRDRKPRGNPQFRKGA